MKEYFPQIGKIPFEGSGSKNPLAFQYCEPERVVLGKKMKDWLKFAMAWWHTLGQASGDQFGGFGNGVTNFDAMLTLEDLVAYAKDHGEPEKTSGKQELYETIVALYCK